MAPLRLAGVGWQVRVGPKETPTASDLAEARSRGRGESACASVSHYITAFGFGVCGRWSWVRGGGEGAAAAACARTAMRLPLLLLVAVAVGSVGVLPPAAAAALSAPLIALNTLNPWMSACDLNDTKEQPWRSVELDDDARALCASGKNALEATLLSHCRERYLVSALNDSAREAALHGGAEDCFDALRPLLTVDELARTVTGDLRHVLIRYDCGQTFSVIHSCADCQVSPICMIIPDAHVSECPICMLIPDVFYVRSARFTCLFLKYPNIRLARLHTHS